MCQTTINQNKRLNDVPFWTSVAFPRPPAWGLGVALLITLLFLGGCGHTTYKPVPECPVAKPPAIERFLEASPDERLVVMGGAYISQVKAVAQCNNRIRATNALNKAKDGN